MRSRWLVAALTFLACGSSNEAPDANVLHPPDADDIDLDAGPSRVEVTAYTHTGDGALSSTAIAFFADPNGAWIAQMPVDAAGIAFADMPSGGSVTVLEMSTSPPTLTTIRGVKRGDKLITGRTYRDIARTGSQLSMQVNVLDRPADATSVQMYGACAWGSTPRLYLFQDCLTPTFDLLATAQTSEGTFFLFQPDNSYVAEGELSLAGPFAPILQPSVAVITPPDVGDTSLESSVIFDGAVVGIYGVSIPPPTGPVSRTIDFVPLEGTMSMLYGEVSVGQPNGHRYPHVTVAPSTSPPTEMDLTSLPLPRFVAQTTAVRSVSWTQVGSGSPDARFVKWNVQWRNPADRVLTVTWEVMEPATDQLSSDLPALPPEYASQDPGAPGTTVISIEAIPAYVDYDHLAGYDDARPLGFQLQEITKVLLDVEHRAHLSIYSRP